MPVVYGCQYRVWRWVNSKLHFSKPIVNNLSTAIRNCLLRLDVNVPELINRRCEHTQTNITVVLRLTKSLVRSLLYTNKTITLHLKQEAQLMLTNPSDAFGGKSRSPNMVPFDNLGTVFLLVCCSNSVPKTHHF